MGKKTRKKKTRRESIPKVLLRRGSFRCEVCYPDQEYKKSSEEMPIVATIYVGRRKIKLGQNEVTLLIAWCSECNRWLAKEKRWRVTMDKVDIATKLSDGECGNGEMDWLTFVCMCDDFRKYCI